MDYLFGDTDLAAYRLQVLSGVFSDSTKAFLRHSVKRSPRCIADLGCGPGHTTSMLADFLEADQAVGLDNSEHFIRLARSAYHQKVSYHLHDVTSIPFPLAPFDILFCRFLLTHLESADCVLGKWATQLNGGGLILIEEVDWIHTANETFALYLNIVDAMLKHMAGNLYMGKRLNQMQLPGLLKRRASHIRRLPVSTGEAATMFFLNIRTWKTQPFAQRNYPGSVISELERNLGMLAGRADGGIEIEWYLRQLVLERR